MTIIDSWCYEGKQLLTLALKHILDLLCCVMELEDKCFDVRRSCGFLLCCYLFTCPAFCVCLEQKNQDLTGAPWAKACHLVYKHCTICTAIFHSLKFVKPFSFGADMMHGSCLHISISRLPRTNIYSLQIIKEMYHLIRLNITFQLSLQFRLDSICP